ncbi:MAG TPA: hypothetical protein VNT26_09070, partial [Candidatus Sulfotelmatobacter sp.]|nr:hypothetical protein [Candidatus Sulfotelmatobacter sp.]
MQNRSQRSKEVRTGESRPARRRFIISTKAIGRTPAPAQAAPEPEAPADSATRAKAAYARSHEVVVVGMPAPAGDLAETIKTLVELAREQGHLTYE